MNLPVAGALPWMAYTSSASFEISGPVIPAFVACIIRSLSSVCGMVSIRPTQVDRANKPGPCQQQRHWSFCIFDLFVNFSVCKVCVTREERFQ